MSQESLIVVLVLANVFTTALVLYIVGVFWRHDRANAQVQREDLMKWNKELHGALLRTKGKPVAAPQQEQMSFDPIRTSTPRPRNGSIDASRDFAFPVK